MTKVLPAARHPGRIQTGDTETQIGITASSISFVAAVLMVVAGMTWGIVMAISHDHAAMPAHAHLNLLGWVSLFLFGVFYHLHPAIDRSRAAMIQVMAWIVSTVVMVVGVALIHSGHEVGEPIAAVGSFGVLFAMLLFGRLVARRRRGAEGNVTARAALAPAE
jgi:cbb3-type cytochrome oxidase subunit 1